MNDAEYLDIILRGYDTHKSCLPDYFETEAKQLNKEKSISFKLFFLRLREVTDRLNNDLTVNLVERQNKLGLAIDNTKNESAKQQYKRDFHNLELICKISLFELTGGKHRGNLFKKDVSLIEENIRKAKGNILHEEKETQIITDNSSNMMFETLSDCGKCEKEFITYEKDLCTNCPIKPFVKTQKDDLVKKFNTLKEVEGAETLSKHLEGKITEWRKKIEDQFNFESREKQNPQIKYRPNRISVVLAFKEYIKFYSEQLTLLKNKKGNLSYNNSNKTTKSKKSYSHKQIAIACHLMNIHIDRSNAEKILKEYSTLTSTDKFLQKLVTSNNELSSLTGNKTANTKHLKDLKAVERLVSGKKHKEALSSIKAIIATFESNLSNEE